MDLAGLAGAGAAGGTAGGAVAFLGASIVSGIDLLLDLAHFPTAVPTAQLVITGEGSLDLQSLAGKAPWGVAQAAARAGVPVVALVGRSALSRRGGPGGRLRRGARADTPRTGHGALPAGRVDPFWCRSPGASPKPRRSFVPPRSGKSRDKPAPADSAQSC